MAEPKCPSCNAEGMHHFKSRESMERAKNGSPWFIVVYCDECGHVHQTLAKHIFITTPPAQPQSPFVIPDMK